MEHYPAAEPGGHKHWSWHLYDTSDMEPYQLPSGTRSMVAKHRLYRTPKGNVSAQPYVARMQARYMRVWLPASWGPQRPAGIHGKWVQLSKHSPNVGLMHAPRMETQLVRVIQIGADVRGQPRALVRYARDRVGKAKPGRRPNPEANPQGTRTTVSTRKPARVRRDRFVRISQPVGQAKSSLGCKIFPWMKKCKPIKTVCPPGTEPDNHGTCLPSGNPHVVHRAARGRKKVRLPAHRRGNPEMSVADDRARHDTGLDRFRKTLKKLGSGNARIVMDRGGLKIQEKRVA